MMTNPADHSYLQGVQTLLEDGRVVHKQGVVLQLRMLLLQSLHACQILVNGTAAV